MTDISISDINRISHDELDKKIDQLSYYIKRVHQRMSALNNFSNNGTEKKRNLQKKFIEKQVTTSSIRTKR